MPQELLDNLGIRDEWMLRYPHELSGGELQRFCIARALATHPRYLICDEVSTMLDAVTQAHIWRVLLDYAEREGAGMLLVSHTPALTERVADAESEALEERKLIREARMSMSPNALFANCA